MERRRPGGMFFYTRRLKSLRVVYLGTASAVPQESLIFSGLQPLCAKPAGCRRYLRCATRANQALK